MLQSFEIHGFRAFSDVRVERLGRVNLIVGKNNVGKTTFLEALRLHALGGSLWELRALLLDRQEALLDSSAGEESLDVASLFHGRRLAASNGGIQLGPVADQAATLHIAPSVLRKVQRDQSDEYYYVEVENGTQPDDAEWTQGLAITLGAARPRLLPVGSIQRFRGRSQLGPVFVPASGAYETELARWWDAVSLTNAEERIVQCLSVIEPIERISLVQNPLNRPNRMFIARISGSSPPVPLKSLGDGIVRMFQIALAAEFSGVPSRHGPMPAFPGFPETADDAWRKDRVLLLDEVENGIHYSVMRDLWRFIFRSANVLDVQVFATAHSWDCLEGFNTAAQEHAEGEGLVIRLERRGEATTSVILNEEELRIVTRERIEVR